MNYDISPEGDSLMEELGSIKKMAKVPGEPVSKMNEEEKRRLLLLKLKHKLVKDSKNYAAR